MTPVRKDAPFVARGTGGFKRSGRGPAALLRADQVWTSARFWKRLLAGAGAGSLVGVLLFTLETIVALRSGAVGVRMEIQGPLELVLAAARPYLPWLLFKIAIVYMVAGALLGAASSLLAGALSAGRFGALLWLMEMVALVALFAWDRAISRPALFDDLLSEWRVFGWLVDRGEPWHPRIAGAVLIAAHLYAARQRAGLRRFAPVALCAALGALALALDRRIERPGGAHPLVVLIGIDAFRPDRLSAYGGTGKVAPNLEQFARDAVLFDRAYTPIAQTQPAWRSLLTARWPHRTGVRYPLAAESRWEISPTLPMAFSQAGYRTSFTTDCSRFNYMTPISGFELRRQPPSGAINFVLEKLRYRGLGVFADNSLGAAWVPEFVDNRALAGIHDPIGYARRLADRLVSEAGRGPTLFAFHATAAHFPGDPVYPFYRRFVDPSEPLDRRLRMTFSPIAPKASSGGWSVDGARDGLQAGAEALYDELLSQADAQLGIILTELKRANRYNDALIVVFSDHGESFHSDFPALAGATPVHGARLGDEENRILLAMKVPSGSLPGAEGKRIGSLVRLLDIGPTLLDLVGQPPLADADGVSLLPLLQGKELQPLRLYAETGFTHALPDAFDPDHISIAPRSLDAYDVRPDGTIQVTDMAHDAVMLEKDFGAFDGHRWIIRSREKDGSVAERCVGECFDDLLADWLSEVSGVPAGS